MKRKLLHLLLLGGIAVLLVGCTTMPLEPVTLTFAYPESPDWRLYQPLVEEFQEEHPHVTIELQPSPAGTSLRDPESGVDVFLWWQDESLITGEIPLVQPIEPFFNRPKKDIKAFYPRSIEMFTWNETLWAIPAYLDMQLMYYNKELFDKAGMLYPSSEWNWSDFYQTAQAMTTKIETGYGSEGYYGYVTSPRWGDHVSFIYQKGAEITDWNDPNYTEALEWYLGLVESGVAAPIKEQSHGDTYEFFRVQKSAMLTGFLADRDGLGFHHMANPWPFEWGVVPLPAGPAGSATLYRAQGYYIAATCEDPETAWLWIEFLSNLPAKRGLPARIAVAESQEYSDWVGEEVAQVALTSVEHLIPRIESDQFPADMLEFYGHTTESVVNNGFRLGFFKSPTYLRRLSILIEEAMQGKLETSEIINVLEDEFGY